MVTFSNIDGEAIVFTEGDEARHVDADSDAAVTGDTDAAAGAVLTVDITANKAAGEDLLGIDWAAPGIVFEEGLIEGSAVYVDDVEVGHVGADGGSIGEAIVIVFQDGTLADIARVMRAITYQNMNQDEPSPLTRTLTFHLAWPSGEAASANVSIEVVPVLDVNDPPAVDMDTTTEGNSAIAAYVEGAAPVVLAPHASVTDSDSSTVTGGSLTIAVTGATAADQLGIQNQGFGAGQIGIESQSIGSDGQPQGSLSLASEVIATFHGGKDGVPLVVTFLTEQASSDTATSSLSALYQAITYSSTSSLPPAQRTVTFTVDDGDGSANGGNPIATGSVTVNIASVNQAPFVDLNGAAAGTGATLTYTENGAAARIAPAATVTDDNPAKFNGGSLTIAFADGGTINDQLTIGTGGPEQIGIDWGIGGVGSDSGAINFGGNILATFVGGKNGAPLVVNFFPEGSVAGFTTLATVQAILRCISYSNNSENPSSAPRTISYTLKDGQGTANGGQDTTVATATVNVTPTPDLPVAVADTLSIVAGQTTQYNVSQLLANDRDPDGDTFNVTAVTAIGGGTVSLANGIVTFTPTSGNPSFRYTITDSTGRTATAVVTLNRAPVAVTDSFGAVQDTAVTFTNFNFVKNDTDAENNALTLTAVSGAVHGSVVLNANGTVTFTPEAGYTGAASFQYTITDGFGFRTGTANVTVRASNAAPTATDDTLGVNEDATLTVPVTILNNDSDSDGGTLVILSVSNATNGTAVLQLNGTVRFVPTANFNGQAGFDYVVSDSQGGTATAHVTINVAAVNDPPVANTNTVATLEDKPIVISWDTLLANDTDVDGDTLTITAVNTFTNGSAVIDSINRTVTFTPAVDYSLGRAFSFRYTISDGKGGTSNAQVNVNVTPVNDAPSGGNGKVGVDSGSYVFAAADFSTGFSDSRDLAPFNEGLNNFAGVVITTLPGSGTLWFDADGAGGADPVAVTAGQFVSKDDLAAGKLGYTAEPGTILNPSFKFQVRDDGGTGNGGQDTDQSPSTMELAITLANDAPRLDLNGAAVGDGVTAAYSIGSTGTIIAPDATLIDDNPSFGGGSLQVYVGGFSFGDRIYVDEVVPGIMLLGSQIYYNEVLVALVTDESGTSLTIQFLAPADAAAVQAIIRSVGYDGTNVFGTDPRDVVFSLNDGGGIDNGGIDATEIHATVIFNNPPVADTSITFAGTEDQPVTVQVASLLANAFDPDGDALTVSAVYGNPDGTAVLSADGATITFTPAANYNGPASFAYDLRDAKGGITHVTVNGTIAATPDDPIARTDTLSAQQGVATLFQASQLLTNDSDPDGPGTLTLTGVTSGSGGTVVLNPDGTIGFTPDGSLLGLVSFTYSVADGNGGTATGTANVTVKKLLAAPEDVTTTYTIADLIGTATDSNGQPYTLVSVSPVSGGGVVLNGDGTVSFTSNLNFNGRANFDFVLHDGAGNPVAGGALVDVAATPDNPTVYPVSLFAPKDQSYTYTAAELLGSSFDPDGTPVTISAVSAGSNGTAVLNADGTVIFTPTAGYEGSASFGFTVSDGNGGATAATANLSVLRALTGTEDQESIFTAAQIVGTGSFSNFQLGFDFYGGDFMRLGNSVTFTPFENFHGLASVDYAVTIAGQRVTGRVLINVASVNDAPFGQNGSATIAEDHAYVFGLADFPISDIVDGDTLAGVVITTKPGAGKLLLDSDGAGGDDPIEVTDGMFVSREHIAAGHLSYVPPADGNGANLGGFTFQVRDSGGTANDGQNTDTVANSFTIAVTSVNDAPVLAASAAAATYAEQAAAVQVAGGVTLGDDQTNFAGGSLTVALSGAAGDALTIAAEGGITVVGNEVRYNGTGFATITAEGVAGFTLAFDADAAPAAVAALIEAVRFANATDTPGDTAREVTFTLTDGGGATNGGHDTATLVRTITVTPVDDGPVAAGNSADATESAAVRIDVLGNDLDPDVGPVNLPAVAFINGNAVTAGSTVTLASGALATLNSDGTVSYDPNGRFNSLISPAKAAWTGSTHSTAVDSFTYTLASGGTATVHVTVTGEDSADDAIAGSTGNDTIVGFPGDDFFMLDNGGNDWVSGGQGDDMFYFGAAFTAADTVRGGLGTDTLLLQGDYTLALSSTSVFAIEMVLLMTASDARWGGQSASPFTYSITTADNTVAAGALMTIQGNRLQAGETIHFDGSAETDGSFRLIGGVADDVLTGGANADTISGGLGVDQLSGGGGNDQFVFRALAESSAGTPDAILAFAAGDLIDLRGIDASLSEPGNDAFAFIGGDAFHNVAGELRVEFDAGVWTVEADVDGDGDADFAIAVHTTNGHALGSGDFWL